MLVTSRDVAYESSEVGKQLFYPLQEAPWCQTIKAPSYQTTQSHFSFCHIYNGFWTVLLNAAFFTDLQPPSRRQRSIPAWQELRQFYSPVQTFQTYVDDSPIILIYMSRWKPPAEGEPTMGDSFVHSVTRTHTQSLQLTTAKPCSRWEIYTTSKRMLKSINMELKI